MMEDKFMGMGQREEKKIVRKKGMSRWRRRSKGEPGGFGVKRVLGSKEGRGMVGLPLIGKRSRGRALCGPQLRDTLTLSPWPL
jgi:hypothetical protein